MSKIVLSVLGYDRPGIIAAVTKTLFELQCNIEDVSQTTLQTEFVGVFIASRPAHLSDDELRSTLQQKLAAMELSVVLKPLQEGSGWTPPPSEAFVITTVGSDRLGLVAGITEVLARFKVNITNLKAVFRGTDDPHHNVMIYEVDVPVGLDQHLFRKELLERAGELGLDLNVQHRDVFEMIHMV